MKIPFECILWPLPLYDAHEDIELVHVSLHHSLVLSMWVIYHNIYDYPSHISSFSLSSYLLSMDSNYVWNARSFSLPPPLPSLLVVANLKSVPLSLHVSRHCLMLWLIICIALITHSFRWTVSFYSSVLTIQTGVCLHNVSPVCVRDWLAILASSRWQWTYTSGRSCTSKTRWENPSHINAKRWMTLRRVFHPALSWISITSNCLL